MKNKKALKEAIDSKRRGHLMNLLMNKIEQNYRYIKSGKKSLIDICKSINVSPQDRRDLLRMANDAMNQYEDYRVSQYGFGMAGSDKEYKGQDDNRTYSYDEDSMYESKKNTITLTESELRKVISESVKKVLKEGSTVNNKDDYFGNVYYSTRNALGETDSVSTGEINPFKPSSKYARRDTGIEYDGWPRRGDGYKKLKKLGYYDYEKGVDANEWDPETERYFNNTSDPENAFDLASKVRRQREYNKENDIDLAGKHPNRNAIYQLSKHGFPTKKLSKLSPETLVAIANDLGVNIWFGGI